MTEQVEHPIRVTHLYALTIPITHKQRKAIDWLLTEEENLDTLDAPEFDLTRGTETFAVTITNRGELDWLELLAQAAEYAAATPSTFPESPAAAQARQQTMTDLARMIREAIGLVKL